MVFAPDSALTNPLCIALDSSDPDECRRLAAALAPSAGLLKVGLTAYASGGPGLVRDVASLAPVFLDLKLHDIPAQVSGALAAIAELGVAYTTVHAAGGDAMVRAARDGAAGRVGVLAVTVLTSLDDDDLKRQGIDGGVESHVLRLADRALGAGADGLVCSPREVSALRARFGARGEGGPLIVVPGVRPRGKAADDQRRVMEPGDALRAGADIVVVGRPITRTDDPAGAARALLEDLS